jgi:hypothetical protein
MRDELLFCQSPPPPPWTRRRPGELSRCSRHSSIFSTLSRDPPPSALCRSAAVLTVDSSHPASSCSAHQHSLAILSLLDEGIESGPRRAPTAAVLEPEWTHARGVVWFNPWVRPMGSTRFSFFGLNPNHTFPP